MSDWFAPQMLLDYGLHFALEVVGQGVLIFAYNHWCRHRWHQTAIWLIGTLIASILTVHLIG